MQRIGVGAVVTLLDIVVLALVQGVSEVLPVGASAHLMLLSQTGWHHPGGMVLLAGYGGVIAALLCLLGRTLVKMIHGLWRLARGRKGGPGGHLAVMALIGAVPAVAGIWAGLRFGLPEVGLDLVGGASLACGLLLLLADRLGMTVRRLEHVTPLAAGLIGLSQVAMLVPGVSGLGLGLTLARLRGYERPDALRFTLLLLLPALATLAVVTGIDLDAAGQLAFDRDAALAAAVSFVFSIAMLTILIEWFKHRGLGLIAFYRICLGGLMLWLAYR